MAQRSAAVHPIGGCREGAWRRRVILPAVERARAGRSTPSPSAERGRSGSAPGRPRGRRGAGPGRLPIRTCLLQRWPTRSCQAEGGVTDPGAPRARWWPQLLSHSRERDGISTPPGVPRSPWGARNPQAAFGLAVHRGTPCPVPSRRHPDREGCRAWGGRACPLSAASTSRTSRRRGAYDVLRDVEYRWKRDTDVTDTRGIAQLAANADVGYCACEWGPEGDRGWNQLFHQSTWLVLNRGDPLSKLLGRREVFGVQGTTWDLCCVRSLIPLGLGRGRVGAAWRRW